MSADADAVRATSHRDAGAILFAVVVVAFLAGAAWTVGAAIVNALLGPSDDVRLELERGVDRCHDRADRLEKRVVALDRTAP